MEEVKELGFSEFCLGVISFANKCKRYHLGVIPLGVIPFRCHLIRESTELSLISFKTINENIRKVWRSSKVLMGGK